MLSSILLIVPLVVAAVLEFLSLRKDWEDYKSKRIGWTICFLISIGLIFGICEKYIASKEHTEDQEKIASLSDKLNDVQTTADRELEASSRNARELRAQLDAQQKQNISNALKLTDQLNHSLG